jgi:hypothetical protein
LLAREVTGKVKGPTEDQLQFFYEGLQTSEPYEAVRERTTRAVSSSTPRNSTCAWMRARKQQRCKGTSPRPSVLDLPGRPASSSTVTS